MNPLALIPNLNRNNAELMAFATEVQVRMDNLTAAMYLQALGSAPFATQVLIDCGDNCSLPRVRQAALQRAAVYSSAQANPAHVLIAPSTAAPAALLTTEESADTALVTQTQGKSKKCKCKKNRKDCWSCYGAQHCEVEESR